ncbi:predicted protein [Postia placenta Mad-698-R]|nr:predicted protein [Postia placenta Mad-698-R]
MVRLLSNFIIPRCLHVPDEAEQPDWDMNVLVIPSDIGLTDGFCIRSDAGSVDDLAELFIATGLGKALRRIITCLSPFLRVASEIDAALSRLVKHAAQSLRYLSLDSSSPWCTPHRTDERIHADHSTAPYFDVSENTCLERLDLIVEPGEVVFDINLGKLMDGLPQLDAILSAPTFDGLTDVDVDVRILDGPDAERDEELAHELRLCLPRLDARVNLAIGFNGILYAARRARCSPFSRRRLSRIGLDWDEDAGKLRCHRIERVSAQDAVVANEETSAEDDRCTNNATTGRILHEAAAYVDAERPSSSNPMDARVPSQPVCDDEPVPPHATAGLGMSVDISAPDNHDDELSALPGSVA